MKFGKTLQDRVPVLQAAEIIRQEVAASCAGGSSCSKEKAKFGVLSRN